MTVLLWWLGALLAAGLAVGLLRSKIAVVVVEGPSMQPTLAAGDRILVRRARISKLQRGQVAVIEKPGADGRWATEAARRPARGREWIIKRIAALPGDPRPDAILPAHARAHEESVPAGQLVALGDNAADSFDSRQIGYIPAERVLGIMLLSLTPVRTLP
jgi:signal peptidase I